MYCCYGNEGAGQLAASAAQPLRGGPRGDRDKTTRISTPEHVDH